MTYQGEIQNGVVVLVDAPSLAEGTRVSVEVTSEPVLRRGSKEAVLHAISQLSGSWAESAPEMDDALEYLRQSKQDQLKADLSSAEPEL